MAFFRKKKLKDGKWHAMAVTLLSPATINDVADRLAARSTVSRADIYAVLVDLGEVMGELMASKRYEEPKEIVGLLPHSTPAYPITQTDKSHEPENALYTDTEEVIDEPQEGMTKEQAQKEAIIRALKRHNGKRKDAARELFISERTLYRKIKELGIDKIL